MLEVKRVAALPPTADESSLPEFGGLGEFGLIFWNFLMFSGRRGEWEAGETLKLTFFSTGALFGVSFCFFKANMDFSATSFFWISFFKCSFSDFCFSLVKMNFVDKFV